MPKPRLIVSPVGISLFLNLLEPERRKRILEYSNNADDIPDEIVREMEELAQEAGKRLLHANEDERRKLSAELNGIYGLKNERRQGNDMHLLIATDTKLGRLATDVVETFLRDQMGEDVVAIVPKELSTKDVTAFSRGIKDMITQLDEQIPRYDERGYEIVFNLTGGFKSLQGYLATIAMFYADRLVYIFERSQELLFIPRLPIKLDEALLRQFAEKLALMAEGMVLTASESVDLPDALLEMDEKGDAVLSGWGILVWNRAKFDILQESLLAFPRLQYERTFAKDFEKATAQDKVRLQEALAKASLLLQENNGDVSSLKRDGGLQYDNYTNKSFGGKPIGHFRVSQGLRVSCIFQNGKLILRRFGKEPAVNTNP